MSTALRPRATGENRCSRMLQGVRPEASPLKETPPSAGQPLNEPKTHAPDTSQLLGCPACSPQTTAWNGKVPPPVNHSAVRKQLFHRMCVSLGPTRAV
jgi:hypothetical protein